MEKAMDSFMTHQRDADEQYHKSKEDRWQRDVELEEKRRREDREHDIRVMQMLGEMFQGGSYNYNTRQYDFDY